MEAPCARKEISMARSILITGGRGFIGSNYYRYAAKDASVYITAPPHSELDILDEDTVKRFFDLVHPEVMINFAAFRNANLAEQERGDASGLAWRTNVVGVENISRMCQEYGTFLIHISTDMVFSGRETNKGPYSETTKPESEMNYLSWYGWTKAEAERIISKNTNAAIIRIGNVTQPIYDPTLDYVGKIIYLFDRGKLYPLFHDQHLTLTFIPTLLDIINILIKERKSGVFHAASKDTFTPYKLGEYLIQHARGRTGMVKGVPVNDYLKNSPNRYPKYGGLLAEKTGQQLRIKSLDWEEIVDVFIDKLGSSFHK